MNQSRQETLAQINKAAGEIRKDEDQLLEALGMLAGMRQIQIMPQHDALTLKPVILLPQRMYDRMLELFAEN